MTDNTCRCGTPIDSSRYICDSCTNTAVTNLSDAADYLTHLDDKRAKRGTNYPKGAGGRSAELPLPYDPRVHAIATSARTALTGWTRLTIHEHGCRDLPATRDTTRIANLNHELAAWRLVYKTANELTPADHATIRQIVISLLDDIAEAKTNADLTNLSRLCEWLADHLDWIATRVWAVDLLNDAELLRDNLVHLFDIPPETMALGICGSDLGNGTVCEHILAAPIGDAHYACPRCQLVHDVTKRRRELLKRSDGILVTMQEGARLLRIGGYNVDRRKMGAVIRIVGIRSKLRTKSLTSGRTVDHYDLGALRDALTTCEADDTLRKEVADARHGDHGRGGNNAATLSA